MTRIKDFVAKYLIPVSLEQSIGAGMLLMALTMIERPFLAGIENLDRLYAIEFAVQTAGALLAIFGAILILKRRAGRKLFALLASPIPIYAFLLYAYYRQGARVGAAGWIAYAALTICIIWLYRRRARGRESGVGEWS